MQQIIKHGRQLDKKEETRITRSSYKLNNPEETNEEESLVSDQNSEEAEW